MCSPRVADSVRSRVTFLADAGAKLGCAAGRAKAAVLNRTWRRRRRASASAVDAAEARLLAHVLFKRYGQDCLGGCATGVLMRVQTALSNGCAQ